MRTVVLPDPPPAAFEALMERRRQDGADRHDEVREGVLHMAPGPPRRHAEVQWQLAEVLGPPARARGLRPAGDFNRGEPEDYRVPDGGLLRPGPPQLYLPSAALVVEILSPGDDTQEKLPFYAAHRVEEVLIIDPDERGVSWLALGADATYHPTAGSAVIDLSADELAERIDWPT